MNKVLCPHCEQELGFDDICWEPIGKEKEVKRAVYYCSKCRKILGFSNG